MLLELHIQYEGRNLLHTTMYCSFLTKSNKIPTTIVSILKDRLITTASRATFDGSL